MVAFLDFGMKFAVLMLRLIVNRVKILFARGRAGFHTIKGENLENGMVIMIMW